MERLFCLYLLIFFVSGRIPVSAQDKFTLNDYETRFPRWRVAANYGPSHISYDFGSYREWGYRTGFDIAYFGKDGDLFGWGIKYDHYQSFVPDEGYRLSNPFIGGTVHVRPDKDAGSNYWSFLMGLGYMGFQEKKVSQSVFKQSAVALCFDLGYDINITRNLYLEIMLSYMLGMVVTDYFEVEDEEVVFPPISRINIGIGLHVHL
ncbi:MAG: hypothetical protein LBQ60_00960 [Bacteroidales bacterium]|jgi:hypothetical protein|nr:hypothetical protein [Bacteroidales bacterium]